MSKEEILRITEPAVQKVINKFYESNFDPSIDYLEIYKNEINKL